MSMSALIECFVLVVAALHQGLVLVVAALLSRRCSRGSDTVYLISLPEHPPLTVFQGQEVD